jgi:hypothetical protein
MNEKNNILSISEVDGGMEIICHGQPADIIIALASTMKSSKEFKAMVQTALHICDKEDFDDMVDVKGWTSINKPLGNA